MQSISTPWLTLVMLKHATFFHDWWCGIVCKPLLLYFTLWMYSRWACCILTLFESFPMTNNDVIDRSEGSFVLILAVLLDSYWQSCFNDRTVHSESSSRGEMLV